MACLPTPKSLEDPLPIFVQNINITLILELTWQLCNNYSWAWGKVGGHTHTIYSWSPGTVAAIQYGRQSAITPSYLLIRPWGGVLMVQCHALMFPGELLNIMTNGKQMIILYQAVKRHLVH